VGMHPHFDEVRLRHAELTREAEQARRVLLVRRARRLARRAQHAERRAARAAHRARVALAGTRV